MKTWPTNLLNSLGRRSLDLLCPPSCVGCQRQLENVSGGRTLCEACLAEVVGVRRPVCPKCAARVPESMSGQPSCPRCEADQLRFDGTFALGDYDGLLRELVLRMKTERSGHLSRLFAELMVERFGLYLRELSFDAVTSIPMGHWKRLLRGVNAPGRLAGELARLLRVPPAMDLLRWSHNPLPQHGLSRPGRFRNVRGRLRLKVGYSLAAPRILIVDDILTTGATCSEAAKALKRQGASQVYVAVVGRTQGA